MAKTIRDILKEKGTDVLSIEADATVFQALKMMERHDVGALIVKKKKIVVGIVTERDYTRKVVLRGLTSLHTTVDRIMTAIVVYIFANQTVDEGMALMTKNRCRHLPVFDNNKMIGLISIRDLVQAQVAEKDCIIDQLVTQLNHSKQLQDGRVKTRTRATVCRLP